MPSRTRIVFCCPFASMDAGRKVAHQGRAAYAALYKFACRCKDVRELFPPPGTLAQRAAWLWAQIPKFQRAGAGLYIAKERRRQDWRNSVANPSALGLAWASPGVKFKKPSSLIGSLLETQPSPWFVSPNATSPSIAYYTTPNTGLSAGEPEWPPATLRKPKKGPRIGKKLRKAVKEAAPKKRLQIGVWA